MMGRTPSNSPSMRKGQYQLERAFSGSSLHGRPISIKNWRCLPPSRSSQVSAAMTSETESSFGFQSLLAIRHRPGSPSTIHPSYGSPVHDLPAPVRWQGAQPALPHPISRAASHAASRCARAHPRAKPVGRLRAVCEVTRFGEPFGVGCVVCKMRAVLFNLKSGRAKVDHDLSPERSVDEPGEGLRRLHSSRTGSRPRSVRGRGDSPARARRRTRPRGNARSQCGPRCPYRR